MRNPQRGSQEAWLSRGTCGSARGWVEAWWGRTQEAGKIARALLAMPRGRSEGAAKGFQAMGECGQVCLGEGNLGRSMHGHGRGEMGREVVRPGREPGGRWRPEPG